MFVTSISSSAVNPRYCHGIVVVDVVVVIIVLKLIFCNISVIAEDILLKLGLFVLYPKNNSYCKGRRFKRHDSFLNHMLPVMRNSFSRVLPINSPKNPNQVKSNINKSLKPRLKHAIFRLIPVASRVFLLYRIGPLPFSMACRERQLKSETNGCSSRNS